MLLPGDWSAASAGTEKEDPSNPNMKKTQRVVSRTLEIIYLLTGEYIVTGCLLIAAKAMTTRYRVKTSLVFNILSILLSSMGLIFNARDVNKLCKVHENPACVSRIGLNAFDINYILISANIVLLCLCASSTVIGSYVLCCLPRETTPPEVMENYFILPTAPPEFHQTPLPLPPPYTPGGAYKEDDETPTRETPTGQL